MCGGLDVSLGEDDGWRGDVLPVGGALSCACCRDFVDRSVAAILVAGLDAIVGDGFAGDGQLESDTIPIPLTVSQQ